MANAVYQIMIDGNDVSNAFDPLLISLSVKTDDKGACDELTIELDDTDGQIQLPRMGAQVSVLLGWSDTGIAQVFVGTVDEANSGGKHEGKSKHGHKKHHRHHHRHHHKKHQNEQNDG